MLGIVAVNGYIPYYRLARAAVGEAWRLEQARDLLIGERAVAAFDEDTITLAVEAALHTLEDRPTDSIGALFFASTTPVFLEKSNAAVIAAACDIPATLTLDITGSLRSATSALALAFDAVLAERTRQALVVAADMRPAEPGTLADAINGDGAAAILIGEDEHVLAELVAEAHISAPVLDTWRRAHDRYLQSDDEAFALQTGYMRYMNEVGERLLAHGGITPDQLAGVALYAPDGRALMRLAKRSPFGVALARMGMTSPAAVLLMQAGNLGAAFAPAQLALLLETARPGDYIALVGYGDGADAYLFRVTEAIEAWQPRRSLRHWLERKGELTYTLAHHFREHWRDKPLWPPTAEPWTSLPLLHREQAELLRFYAQRCSSCGAVWWPHRPNCYDCGAQSGFEMIRLSRRGTVASFVAEWAVPTPMPPLGMVTVDTPEGARITTQSTDGDPRTFAMGDEVEFALRVFHTAKNVPHYSWKVRKA